MMHFFLKRLYRERRRAMVTLILTFFSGLVTFWGSLNVLFGIPMPLVAGLAFMVVLTSFLMVLAVAFPSIRTASETCGSVLLIFAFFGLIADQGSFFKTYTAILGFTSVWVASTLYTSDVLDRILPTRTAAIHGISVSRLWPETLFPYFHVTPDNFQTHGSDETRSVEWLEAPETMKITLGDGRSNTQEYTIKITSEDAPRYTAGRFEFLNAEKAIGMSGHTEETLSRHRLGTQVDASFVQDKSNLRLRLFHWMDDTLGRATDQIIERAEQREAMS